MQLTPHFTLEELLQSETATRNNYLEQFNPPQSVIDNLKLLCDNVLEPLRAKISAARGVDTPVIITSAYRCARVNDSVPGSANHSQHEDGCAADTHIEGMSIEAWYQFIKASGIPFGQLIQEHNFWAHISHDLGSQRNQTLKATGTIAQPIYSSY